MLLAEGLRSHRGPLRASLQAVYGVRLARHDLGVLELAELTAALPAGCAFWQSFGGPLAWSESEHLLVRVELRLRELQWMQAGKGQRPEPLAPPPFAHEKQAEEDKLSRAQRMFEKRFGK